MITAYPDSRTATRASRSRNPLTQSLSSFIRAPRLVLLAHLLFLGAYAAPPASIAQPTSNRDMAFARYVPNSAKFFVSVRHLSDLDEALRKANVWRLVPALAVEGDHGGVFDMRLAMRTFLGTYPTFNLDELMRSELAFAAPSWDAIDEGVWLVRAPEETSFDRWFPPQRILGRPRAAPEPCFQTRDGLAVCERGRIAMLARRRNAGALMDSARALLAGSDDKSLARLPEFRDLSAYLPADALAVAYWAVDPERADTADASSNGGEGRLLGIGRAVFGLYEGDGRIDLAVRALRAVPHPEEPLDRRIVRQFMQLPQTTLFASALRMDFARAFERAKNRSDPGALERYLLLLATAVGANDADAGDGPRLGPHVILLWGQDLAKGGVTPQVAAMIECEDGIRVRQLARRVGEELVGLLRAFDPIGARDAVEIVDDLHLGVSIHHIPLVSYADQSTMPWAKLLRHLDPAWTVWNERLIVALTPQHIEHILDAHFGLVPTLATVPDIRSLGRRLNERTVLAIIQADLATDLLTQWVKDYREGKPSLLDPGWWQSRIGSGGRLGIGMSVDQSPGEVQVVRVYPTTAADGVLRVGDRIIGIDGRLLSLSAPNDDLRRLWGGSNADDGPKLRILRDGEILEVAVARETRDGMFSRILLDRGDAVQELAAIGRAMQFVSFAVDATDERHFSALLSVRLAPVAKLPGRLPEP